MATEDTQKSKQIIVTIRIEDEPDHAEETHTFGAYVPTSEVDSAVLALHAQLSDYPTEDGDE